MTSKDVSEFLSIYRLGFSEIWNASIFAKTNEITRTFEKFDVEKPAVQFHLFDVCYHLIKTNFNPSLCPNGIGNVGFWCQLNGCNITFFCLKRWIFWLVAITSYVRIIFQTKCFSFLQKLTANCFETNFAHFTLFSTMYFISWIIAIDK